MTVPLKYPIKHQNKTHTLILDSTQTLVEAFREYKATQTSKHLLSMPLIVK